VDSRRDDASIVAGCTLVAVRGTTGPVCQLGNSVSSYLSLRQGSIRKFVKQVQCRSMLIDLLARTRFAVTLPFVRRVGTAGVMSHPYKLAPICKDDFTLSHPINRR
jgi:hypothetical protein